MASASPGASNVRPLPATTYVLRKLPSADTVKKVVQSFNTWAFKREQPSDPDLLTRFVARAMARQEPLSFVLYWGKGPRSGIDQPDIQCLDYLAHFAARIKAVYPKGALM